VEISLKTSRTYCCCAGLRVREVLRGRLEVSSPSAFRCNEECSCVLGSTTVRGVSDDSPSGRTGRCAVGGNFSSEDPSFDDDESSESGDGDTSVSVGFAFAGAYRADNMPSTTLRNFNGWEAFGGLNSEGAWTWEGNFEGFGAYFPLRIPGTTWRIMMGRELEGAIASVPRFRLSDPTGRLSFTGCVEDTCTLLFPTPLGLQAS